MKFTPNAKHEDVGAFVTTAKDAWAARKFLLGSVLVSAAIASALAFSLPNKFTSKLEIRTAALWSYGPVFEAVAALDRLKNPATEAVDMSGNSDFLDKSINNAIGQTIYEGKAFEKAYTTVYKTDEKFDYNAVFNRIFKYRELTAQRGNEKAFSPGYLVELTLDSESPVRQLTAALREELEKSVNSTIISDLASSIKLVSDLNMVNRNVNQYKFGIASEIKAKNIEDAISLAKIGGISKPLVPTDVAISSQIPLQNAVPQYFFGYEILEREKELVEMNAKDEKQVPGFAEMIAHDRKLAAISELLLQTKHKFVEIRIVPKIENNFGTLARVAIILGITFLLSIIALSAVLIRNFMHRMSASTV